MKSGFVPHEQKTSCLNIHRYDGRIPVGAPENSRYDRPPCFRSLTELPILPVEALSAPPRVPEAP